MTAKALIFARHAVGMLIIAAANPLIYYSSDPFSRWVETWLGAIAVASILFGLYALFFTERAKGAWPKSFFILAWVLLVAVVAGPWLQRASKEPSQVNATAPAKVSEIDAFLKDAPAHLSTADVRARLPYIEAVALLKAAVAQGRLPVGELREPRTDDDEMRPLSPEAVADLESTQTWWVDEGRTVWMHLVNRTAASISLIAFNYAEGTCANPAGPAASYQIPLAGSVRSGGDALIRFSAQNMVSTSTGCLTITGARG